MTLLFMDGFDMDDALDKGWVRSGSYSPESASVTRYSRGSSLSLRWNASVTRRLVASPRVIFGVAFRPGGTSDYIGLLGDSASVEHVRVRRTPAGTLGLYRGSSLLQDTGLSLVDGEWIYIEAEATIANSGGVFRVWVDGAMVADFVGDTRNAGSSDLIDGMSFGVVGGTVDRAYFDDLYVLSVDGAGLTERLGEVSIQTLMPDGPGSLTEQTPVGSAQNWQNVDNIPYSTSAYNRGTVAGLRDLYTATDPIPALSDVKAVAMNVIASRTEPGTGGVRTLLKSGATTVTGPDVILSPNISVSQDFLPVNPATGAPWTVAELQAIEIGSEVL